MLHFFDLHTYSLETQNKAEISFELFFRQKYERLIDITSKKCDDMYHKSSDRSYWQSEQKQYYVFVTTGIRYNLIYEKNA